MGGLQPLGYTNESVAAGYTRLQEEALQIISGLSAFQNTIRPGRREARIDEQIVDYRQRLSAIGIHELTAWDSLDEESSMRLLGSFEAISKGRMNALEFMHQHPEPSFHFGFLQRMYDVLAKDFPYVLEGTADLSNDVPEALCKSDTELFPWFTHMRNLLHESKFMNGVSWPPNLGNAFGRYETFVTREQMIAELKNERY